MENIKTYMLQVGKQARTASRTMAQADTNAKNRALEAIAQALIASSAALIAANAKDVSAARANGLDDASLDRLRQSNLVSSPGCCGVPCVFR